MYMSSSALSCSSVRLEEDCDWGPLAVVDGLDRPRADLPLEEVFPLDLEARESPLPLPRSDLTPACPPSPPGPVIPPRGPFIIGV